MSARGILLIGGGGHAKVVFDTIRASGMGVIGYCDDNAHSAMSGTLEYLGAIGDAGGLDAPVVIAIGDVGTRRRFIGELGGGARFAEPIIHPSAVVSASAEIGEGVLVGPGAVINADARVGSHAIINSGVIVEHDCRVGENVHVAPGTVLGGGVSVGGDTLVGIGSRVLPGVVIGEGCVVGAGAVVTRDVGGGDVVVGVPGRRRD